MTSEEDLMNKPETFKKISREWYLATALYDAIDDGDIRQVTILLTDKHACPNTIIPEYEVSPLHFAVGHECESFGKEVTRLILKFGGDVNLKGQNGLTPIQVAVAWNRTSVVRLLLSYGADPFITDDDMKDAFHYAYEQRSWESLKALDIFTKIQLDGFSEKTVPSYTLNLEKVIVYGNDVQAEYETATDKPNLFSVDKNSIGTQTSLERLPFHPVYCSQKDNKCTCSKQINAPCSEQMNVHCQEFKNLVIDDQYDWCKNLNNDVLNVNSKSKIMQHRKGVLYEYDPNFKHIVCNDSILSDKLPLHEVNISEEGNCDNDYCKSGPSKELKNITIRKEQARITTDEINTSLISEDNSDILRSDIFSELGVSDSINPNKLIPEDCIRIEDDANKLEYKATHFLDNVSKSNLEFEKKSEFHDRAVATFEDQENFMSDDNKGSANFGKIGKLDNNIFRNGDQETEHKVEKNLYSDRDVNCSMGGILKNSDLVTEDESNLQKHITWSEYVSTYTRVESTNSSPYVSCQEEADNYRISGSDISSVSALDIFHDNKQSQTVLSSFQQGISASSTRLSSELQMEDTSFKEEFKDDIVLEITERYKYTDEEDGVVFIEERLPFGDKRISKCELISSKESDQTPPDTEKPVQTSDGSAYDTDNLRHQLKCRGFIPGPITGTTKTLYLRKLKKMKREKSIHDIPPLPEIRFSSELEQLLYGDETEWSLKLSKWSHIEAEMSDCFLKNCSEIRCRDSASKTSFTYLLLDPRITDNLPRRCKDMEPLDIFKIFMEAIFYIGKGKSYRPYTHLYNALNTWNYRHTSVRRICGLKEKRILEIWNAGFGVVCLHVFQNITPAEALTREAAMIDAVGLDRLKNEKYGTYYGGIASWYKRRKQQLGIYLCYRAMMVFIADGERQIKPESDDDGDEDIEIKYLFKTAKKDKYF